MLRHAGRLAGHTARLVHLLLTLALGLTVVLGTGAAMLAWRLAQGPIELPWLAHRLEMAVNSGGGPTHFTIGSAGLAWEGFRAGVDRPLDIRLGGVQALAADGSVLAEVPRAELSLSPGGLLHGRILPRALEIDGARLRALRAADGSVALDLGSLTETADAGGQAGAPSAAGAELVRSVLTELARPAQTDAAAPRAQDRLFALTQLQRLRIQNARLTVIDRQLDTTWRAPQAMIDLRRRPQGGVSGFAEVSLALGDSTARLDVHAELDPRDRTTAIEAQLSPVTPAALARTVPTLAALGALDAPVRLAVTAELGAGLALRQFSLRAALGAGTVQVAGGTVPLSGGNLDAVGDPDHVTLRQAVLRLPGPDGTTGPVFQVSGEARRQGDRIAGHLALGFDRVAFAELPQLWPARLAHNARDWVTENITAGWAHDGSFDIGFAAPVDFSSFDLTAASGTLQGDDLTVHWLRPVPPIEHGVARLTLLGPDVLEITASSGRQGAMAIGASRMRIWGLTVKDQFATLDLTASGQLTDAVALLRHKRLHLLDRSPMNLQDPSGSFDLRLGLQLPLEHKLTMEQIAIHAQTKLTGLHLSSLVAGQDLDDGRLELDATNSGLTLTGPARLAGIPARLDAAVDFRAGSAAQVVTRATLTGTADEAQLAQAGIDTLDLMHGPAALDVSYAKRRDGQAELDLRADLRQAALDAEPAGWSKPAGAAASASARVLLDHDRVLAVNDIRAQAPGLALAGRADFAAGKLQALRLDRAAIGRSEATGEVRFALRPGEPMRITLTGRELDLSSQLSSRKRKPKRPEPEKPGSPWMLQASFQHVLLSGTDGLAGVTMNAESDGRVLRHAALASTGPARLEARIVPEARSRLLTVTAGDAGALLRVLDVTGSLHGGALSLSARYDDTRPGHPLAGTAEISDFTISDAPAVARVLQALTVYGIVEATRGPGFGVSRLVAPFRLDGDVLELGEARAFTASLGATATGRIDLASRRAALDGTIVPAYALNSALGRIPVLGKLFSPEQGGGLFAATYTVRGPLDNPEVKVNPLAALTPGFLRSLFGALAPAQR